MTTKKISQKIQKAYKIHLLTEGERPKSIFLFCKAIKITATEFYENFTSL